MTKLTGVVLTYNESEHITDCLYSLNFADETVVIDSGSTDDTVELARTAGALVIHNEFAGYASQRNFALSAVSDDTDWILFVDADERVPSDLAEEIRQAILQREYDGYRIPRYNYLFGKLTKGAGWYPDYQTRLLKAGQATYVNPVHEVVELDGKLGTLQHHFIHYNYRDLDHFIAKQRKYSQYDAEIMFNEGIRPKPHNYILQPLRHFRWRFFKLKGYQDGWHGLRLSALMAWYELRKYQKLGSLWRDQQKA